MAEPTTPPSSEAAPRVPVWAVVIHWNQSRRCSATVEALLGSVDEVVVVDNGSDPDHLAEVTSLAGAHPAVTLLEAGRNLGFGPGANLGMRLVLERWRSGGAGTGWLVICPHDAMVEPSTVATGISLMDAESDIGLACADVGDGMVPVHDPYFGGMIVPGEPHDPADDPRIEVVDYPHGTFMFARLSCLDEIGVFDERYFAYCEEADLGARARGAGWRVVLLRGVRVTNTSVTTGTALVDYLQHRNTLLLVAEHSGRYHATIRWLIAVGHLVSGRLWPARSSQFVYDAGARRRALIDAPLGRFGPPPPELVSEAKRLARAREADIVAGSAPGLGSGASPDPQ